jgi:Kef-type K+ transport system membrane component KefB
VEQSPVVHESDHRPRNPLLAYTITVALPVAGLLVLLTHTAFASPTLSQGASAETGQSSSTAGFLTALAVIVLVARVFGSVARRFGQPRVIGEILAGIALGPSLLGLIPGASAALFPAQITPYLDPLAQMGLVLFMFLVGAELDLRQVRGRTTTLILGHASIAIPSTLGALLAMAIYPQFAPDGVDRLPFVLFVGLALGITAFPVLACILSDRGLSNTSTGALALAGAAIADVTAWCLMAIVISVLGSDIMLSIRTIGLSALFCAAMVLLVRPALRALLRVTMPDSALMIVLGIGALLAALATDLIGVHTIFGAFLFGAMLPHDAPQVRAVVVKIETFCLSFLLPVFFTQFGLNFRIGDIGTNAALWGLCAVIIVVATIGKLGGSTVALRMCGQPWREAASIGALMNCRGLTELIVLNIGLHLGVLNHTLFTLMVIMALITTIATGPLVTLLQPRAARASPRAELAPQT